MDTFLDSRISGIVEINYRIGKIIITNKDLQMNLCRLLLGIGFKVFELR